MTHPAGVETKEFQNERIKSAGKAVSTFVCVGILNRMR